MTIKKTKVLLHMPHIFLHLAIGKVKTKQILLNRLRVFLWEIEHNLLLGAIRPDVVIDLAVLPPPLEAHVIVDLEEVIAHLVVRQNLRSHENPSLTIASFRDASAAYIQYQSSLLPFTTLYTRFCRSHRYKSPLLNSEPPADRSTADRSGVRGGRSAPCSPVSAARRSAARSVRS